jgi:hypothetical protein
VKPAEAQEMLNDMTGAWLQISRFYQEHWPDRTGDPQVNWMDQRLRGMAKQFEIRVPWFSVEPTDQELDERLERVGEHYLRVREAVHRRMRQDHAVSHLLGMLDEAPDFSDLVEVERLAEACAEVLESGVPPSHPTLREALIPYSHLLQGDPRLEKLVQAVEGEIVRRDQAASTSAPKRRKTKDEKLTEEQLAVLREVRPHTQGRKLVILGGDPRGEQSRAIQEALQASAVHWPKMKALGAGAGQYEPDIRKGEIVIVLQNFLKIPLRAIRDVAEKHQARVVNVPGGWSPIQIAQLILEQWGLKQPTKAAA